MDKQSSKRIIFKRNKIRATDLDTNQISEYDNLPDASLALDLQISNIISCCESNSKSKIKKYHRKNYILEYIV